jgi:hypothetical protein
VVDKEEVSKRNRGRDKAAEERGRRKKVAI